MDKDKVWPVAQVELFFTRMDGTYDDFVDDVSTRRADGARIKLAFRIRDPRSVICLLATEHKKTSDHRQSLRKKFIGANSFLEFILERRMSIAYSKLEYLRRRCWEEITAQLKANIEHIQSIALENNDRSFRMADKSEYYELLTSVRKATHYFVFVFDSSVEGLLFDRGNIVSSITLGV